MDFENLTDIIRTYDVPIDPGAVREALKDGDQPSALATWIKHHLTPDTLLSRDEYEQYTALERAGVAEQLASSAGLTTLHGLSDREMRDAISELNRSTEAIEKQTEMLRQQQDALLRLVKSACKSAEARADLEFARSQKWENEHKSAATALEELSQNIDFKISELEQQGKGTDGNVNELVDGILRSDDKLLASLQKLGHELDTGDPQEDENISKLREVCARLIKHTVETVRTKLDRLYLESLESSTRSGSLERASSDDVSALREEVESLYSEILPVAQMSVEQQFLEPALKSVSTKNRRDTSRSVQAFQYIHACLDYLLDRMEKLSSRIEAFRAHEQATRTLIGTARAELAVQLDPTPLKRERRPTNTSSPTRRRKSSGHAGTTSPIRVRATPGRRRSSGGHSDEPPLEQLLRTLALALPQQDDGSAAVSDGQAKCQVSTLETAISERTEKVADVARNVQESFESSAATQLADMRRALQLVRDSVLAESPVGMVRLLDPEIEASIAVLAQEVQNVQTQLEGLEVDLAKTRGRSTKRDELIRRWGR